MMASQKGKDVLASALPTLSNHVHGLHLIAFQDVEDNKPRYGDLRLSESDMLAGRSNGQSFAGLADCLDAAIWSRYSEKVVKLG